MTERPILYSSAMVRAKRAGLKTQTRRAIKMDGRPLGPRVLDVEPHGPEWKVSWDAPTNYGGEVQMNDGWASIKCPYGVPGDHLWTREAFSYWHGQAIGDRGRVWYWADGSPSEGDWTKPKPSIHLPRWACRSVDELTEVRVERLQDISEQDCYAEGIKPSLSPDPESRRQHAIAAYMLLWVSINGSESWAANPWVWVLTFRSV